MFVKEQLTTIDDAYRTIQFGTAWLTKWDKMLIEIDSLSDLVLSSREYEKAELLKDLLERSERELFDAQEIADRFSNFLV